MLKVVINSGILNIINARPKTKLYKKKRKEYPSVSLGTPSSHAWHDKISNCVCKISSFLSYYYFYKLQQSQFFQKNFSFGIFSVKPNF